MKTTPAPLLVAAILLPCLALAQHFKPVQVNPFGMLKSDTLSLQAFAMADMNRDSLPDLLYTDDATFNTFLIINQGVAGQPDFNGSPVVDFEDEENGYGLGTFILFNSRLVDFDLDGDIDHLYCYSSDDPNLPAPYVVELNQPELAPSVNFDFLFFDKTELTSYGIPYIPLFNYENFEYKDLTGDGRPDILGSRINENSGQQEFVFYGREAPDAFAAPVLDPFGLDATTGLYGQPCLLDTDGDGDQDVLFLDVESGNWMYYKNEGSSVAPLFAPPVINPFNLTPVPEVGATAFVIDINQDGKEDVMAANLGNFYYYEFDADVAAFAPLTAANVRIFPTLITAKCQVVVDGEQEITKVVVRDVNGRTVFGSDGTTDLDLTPLVPGMYTVTVYLADGSRYNQQVVRVLER